jgi:hypothetical protein
MRPDGTFTGTKAEFLAHYGNPESWGVDWTRSTTETGDRIGIFSVGKPWAEEIPRHISANLTLVPLQRAEEG